MHTLAEVDFQEEVVITEFGNDSQSIKRLLSLGLEPGAIVRCEYRTVSRGTLCISNKNRMIAIDQKEAAKIYVSRNFQAEQI